MNADETKLCTAFAGTSAIAAGTIFEVAVHTKTRSADIDAEHPIMIFDAETGQQLEIDLRGSVDDVRRRYAANSSASPSGRHDDNADQPSKQAARPGRPKLGVVAREVTLLPRHWEWLNSQPGGASVALRKLVDSARKSNGEADQIRLAQEAAYRFMSAMAGNAAGFEEASRALFASDQARFEEHTQTWPKDVSKFAAALAMPAFSRAGE